MGLLFFLRFSIRDIFGLFRTSSVRGFVLIVDDIYIYIYTMVWRGFRKFFLFFFVFLRMKMNGERMVIREGGEDRLRNIIESRCWKRDFLNREQWTWTGEIKKRAKHGRRFQRTVTLSSAALRRDRNTLIREDNTKLEIFLAYKFYRGIKSHYCNYSYGV